VTNYLPFRPVWVAERSVIPVFNEAPESKGDDYRSFVRVHGRQDEADGMKPIDGMFRICVPCRGKWPDCGSVMIEVAPNRAHMVDVKFFPGSNVPCVTATDIGPNNISEYQVFYPWEEFNKFERDGTLTRVLVAAGYLPQERLKELQ